MNEGRKEGRKEGKEGRKGRKGREKSQENFPREPTAILVYHQSHVATYMHALSFLSFLPCFLRKEGRG